MITPVQAWERYAQNARPRRRVNAAGARTWLNWTQYADHGPDESVLGEVAGRTIVELGSGSGSNLAHLATLGAHCTGVDIAPARAAAASRNWRHLPNLRFVTADAAEYLAEHNTDIDIVYSIFGAVWFTDPAVLVPLVRTRLRNGGTFSFSQLPPTSQPVGPDRVIRRWDYSAERWVAFLTAEGFGAVTAEVIPAPGEDEPGTLLVRASVE